MFYRTCTVLASELSEFWEPIIYGKSDQIIPFWMDVCTRRSALLASDRTDSSSSRSPSATTCQFADLDFSTPADSSVDWNPVCLDTSDSESCEGCYNLYHNDTPVESLSTGSFAGLLLEVSNYRHEDLYLYGSFELMVLFFELTMICGLMCQN